MAIEGFQYEEFAKNLALQAKDFIPQDIDESAKSYIVNIILNYCIVAGESLNNDSSLALTAEQAFIICQFIGEWAFHKSIDIIRANVPEQNRDEILQKIAFTIFEVAKKATISNVPLQQMVALVEQQVKITYEHSLKVLQERGAIDEQTSQSAMSQSNIDAMAAEEEIRQEQQRQEAQSIQEEPAQSPESSTQSLPTPPPPPPPPPPVISAAENTRLLKLASLALLITKLPHDKVLALLSRFDKKDASLIVQYSKLPDLQSRIDNRFALQYLKELQASLSKSNDPQCKIVKKFKSIVNNSAKKQISAIIDNERSNVKVLVEKVQKGQSVDFTLSSIYLHNTDIICGEKSTD